ncbi:head-tail connector protein [Mesobacterium sp. TK19101]|uniref:Head-tail connector protein n=1 Tax=Mesobacterium hydrothermale TaxID=3111907 RepID=A0ABU6HID7_9RHOB|nr:head-tail connector protein [Mesobacterium sp. TK19101]MEC3862218.1 head-tail connector protein [Mesobacterium sp. TK19101]
MMLIEETQVPEAALPVEALKRHLRLGTGFAESTVQDGVLASFLRAALAAIEGRTDKALIERGFVLVLNRWKDVYGQPLPIAPVSAVTAVGVLDRDGNATALDPRSFRLERDATVPRLMPAGGSLPGPPEGGAVEIRFTAGFGGWDALPADLAQAVLLLAAHYYEYRDETALAEGCMPFGVTSLIARYRRLRLGLGQ